MIRLTKPEIAAVLQGRRTMLLEPLTHGTAPPYRAGTHHAVHRDEATLTPARCRVHIARTTDIALGELDDTHAHALGHRDRYALMAHWTDNVQPWDPETRAWLITFRLDTTEPPRLLHRRSEKGYTTNRRDALPDEPEAIPANTLDLYAQRAQRADADRVDEILTDRARLPINDRLKLAIRDAEARGAVIDKPLRVITERIAEIERAAHAQRAA
jgi:hypothetical protein